MKAERGKIAKQFRSEGERDASRMIAEAEREKTRIAAEAYEEAARLKAEGEAEAMRIYADAFGRNPSFYRFLRTLQAYETVLDEQHHAVPARRGRDLHDPAGRRASPAEPGIGPGAPAPGTDDLAAGERAANDRSPRPPTALRRLAEEAVP